LPRNKLAKKILIYHPGAETIRTALLSSIPNLRIATATDDADFRLKLPDAAIVIGQRFDPTPLRNASALEWLHITLAGIDFLAPMKEHLSGVTLTNARGIIADHIANYVIGVMVLMQWNFPALMRNQSDKIWKRWATKPLAEQVTGIIGLGAIGQEIAKRVVALGLTAIGVRASGNPVPGVTKVFRPEQIEECLRVVDFVVLALFSTKNTAKLMREREFSAIRGALTSSKSREAPLSTKSHSFSALERKLIGGVCLDVFAEEPLPRSSPLWTLPNTIITPHPSGLTTDYDERNAALIVDNIRRYHDGEPLLNIVDLGPAL
jgi:phosphoglycerate dehydrogenase-like enzyme